MKTIDCSMCRIEHEVCRCGELIWRNPRTGRVLEAHGDLRHYCQLEPVVQKERIKKKEVTKTAIKFMGQKAPIPVKKFTGGFTP